MAVMSTSTLLFLVFSSLVFGFKDCNNAFFDFQNQCDIVPNSGKLGSQNVVHLLENGHRSRTKNTICDAYVLRYSIFSSDDKTQWLTVSDYRQIFETASNDNDDGSFLKHLLAHFPVENSASGEMSISPVDRKYEENGMAAITAMTQNLLFHIEIPLYSMDISLKNNFLLFAEIRRKYSGSIDSINPDLMTEIDLLVLIFGTFSDQLQMFLYGRVFHLDCHPGNQLYTFNSHYLEFA